MVKYLVVFGWNEADHFREQTMLYEKLEDIEKDINSGSDSYDSWEIYEVTRTTGYQETKTTSYEDIINLLEKEND